ncbi:MAG: DNA repair protein RecO [Elusimicrobiota bacterium]|jgi:DNA repair protein RecO (recombination protein O)|nr:DNA repair protein RecO [Elusimicrobiota bacterium]
MYYQIRGLVLNVKTHNDADKAALIYTYEWGKITALVPSAKKIAAKLNGATEPLTESEFMVYQNHQLMRPKITGAQIINNHSKIKTTFKSNLYALYAAEISDKLLPFNTPNEQKYRLISRIWTALEECKNCSRALSAFTLRFLSLSGYDFRDYIKTGNLSIDAESAQIINKISNCNAADLDEMDFDDKKISALVEEYLLNYIKKPSVSTFIQKLQKHGHF